MRKDPSTVRIRDVLLEMRRYRMGLIQTADQLRFSYLAVIEGAKCIMGDTSLQVNSISLLVAAMNQSVIVDHASTSKFGLLVGHRMLLYLSSNEKLNKAN